MASALCWRNSHVRRKLRARRLAVLRRIVARRFPRTKSLFQLIGTTYGGDGESTFALPDLRGRIPIHQGNGFIVGETGGVENVTLTVQPDSGAQPCHCSASIDLGQRARPGQTICSRKAGQQIRTASTSAVGRADDSRQARIGRSAAVNRTTISSPINVSIS